MCGFLGFRVGGKGDDVLPGGGGIDYCKGGDGRDEFHSCRTRVQG
jgi:Ca2+-binding RTX toxin-like protein